MLKIDLQKKDGGGVLLFAGKVAKIFQK